MCTSAERTAAALPVPPAMAPARILASVVTWTAALNTDGEVRQPLEGPVGARRRTSSLAVGVRT